MINAFKMLLRLVGPIEAVEIGGQLYGRVAMQRRVRRNAFIDLDRKLRLLQGFIKIGKREKCQRVRWSEKQRKLEIDQAQVLAAAAAE